MSPLPEGLCAPPRKNVPLADCYWYHTVELPGSGPVQGDWVLSHVLDHYLGGVPLRGRSVLEIGAASGCLTRQMEEAGAEVVAYDLNEEFLPDNLVRLSSTSCEQYIQDFGKFQIRLNNSFWHLHQACQLKARMVHGSVYQMPAALGRFDVGTICCVLVHLRDPFLALHQLAAHTRETLVITEWLHGSAQPWRRKLRPLLSLIGYGRLRQPQDALPAFFMPQPADGHHAFCWWVLTPELLTRMLSMLGFAMERVLYHDQLYQGKPQALFTVVARRQNEGYRIPQDPKSAR